MLLTRYHVSMTASRNLSILSLSFYVLAYCMAESGVDQRRRLFWADQVLAMKTSRTASDSSCGASAFCPWCQGWVYVNSNITDRFRINNGWVLCPKNFWLSTHLFAVFQNLFVNYLKLSVYTCCSQAMAGAIEMTTVISCSVSATLHHLLLTRQVCHSKPT